MEIKDYKVLVHNGTSILSASVMNYLCEGYELQGGVSVTSYLDKNDDTKFQYSQAIVKYE